MNIQQLRYVIEISRQGSFNKTSQALFISQPALSNAIKDLETELGYSIFIRDRKGVRPTDEGRQFLVSAQTIIQELENIQQLHIPQQQPQTQILKFSSDRAAFVAKALVEFSQDYLKDKKYALHLYEKDSAQVIIDVVTRKVDVGIIAVLASENMEWIKDLKKRDIVHHFLFRTRSYAILRKGHPLLEKSELHLKDFYKYPVFRTDYDDNLLDDYNLVAGFPFYDQFEQTIFTDSMRFMYNFIGNSDGIFIGTTQLHVEELHPFLTALPLPDINVDWEYYYICRKGYRPAPIVAHFLKYLEAMVSEQAGDTAK
ncbi:LysR family transcriptional regulator [Clostridium sp. AF19-22AC]|uniref:LysR family transcriptional regulator n=1 Tax=Clostridia TaxID=186801 RepID=UPI000E4AFF6D|nr:MULTISPECIES: LysR family transcriptional regulator [Clostridia]RHR32941.1 LysR family transcriptional regulator [Clostridium sp. AF19-22AC]